MLTPERILRKNRSHMIGIEPYIIGALKGRMTGRVLDLGTGMGSWGYAIRSYSAMESSDRPFIVGVEMDRPVLDTLMGMRIYDGLVRADIVRLPMKPGCFDVIIGVESVFANYSKALLDSIERLVKSDGLLVLSGILAKANVKELMARGYEVHGVWLWGLALKNLMDGSKAYIAESLRRVSFILSILQAVLHGRRDQYVIAVRGPARRAAT